MYQFWGTTVEDCVTWWNSTIIVYSIPQQLLMHLLRLMGPNSRCVDFRIDGNWIIQNSTVGPIHGGACYEVCVCVGVWVWVWV